MPLLSNDMIIRKRATATTWWNNGGAISGCVAAYAAKGAASLAASYTNLANPGTNNAAPGVAPTWDVSNGWTFNGTTQYLTTGITPTNTQIWSVIIRYSGVASSTVNALFGSWGTAGATPYFTIQPRKTTGVGYGNGDLLTIATGLNGATLAFAGTTGYRNGIAESGSIPAAAGTFNPIFIGGVNQAGTAARFIAGSIQAFAIYSITLTSSEVSSITTAMNGL